MIKAVSSFFLNLMLLLLVLYFSLFAAWYAAYSNYFFFPLVYRVENIQDNVQRYAPLNTHGKNDFGFVSEADQVRIFTQMLRGVDRGSEGLAEITYPSITGGTKRFLTRDELLHLQDVAKLLSNIRALARPFIVLLLFVALAMIFARIRPLYTRYMLLVSALSVGALSLLIKSFSFYKIFYWLHTKVFPPGHKWFFYYQDSLMTTMLKAPDSFALFGLILGGFTMVFFVLFYWLGTRLIRKYIRED